MSKQNIHIFFPHIVNTIKHLNVDLDQIVILVKDRYQGLRLSLFLQNLNIPTKANISSSLLDSSMFSLFETLLFLTYSSRSESLIKKLLTHPLIDAPHDLLKEDLKNPILQKISIDFTLLNKILEHKGLHAYLYHLMEEKIFGRKSLGELICVDDKNYLTMMQIFSLFLTNFDKNPKDFISKLQKLDPDVFPFLKKSCGIDKKSITIMTSHLSKGLEFDVVFALSLYSRIKTLPKDYNEAISLDKEKMRLLYVTLTRAKSHLFIYGTLFCSLFPLNKGCGSPLELFLSRVDKNFLTYEELYKNILTLSYEEIIDSLPIPTSIINKKAVDPWDISDDNTMIITPDEMKSYEKSPLSLSFSSLPFKKNEYSVVEKAPEFPFGAKVGHQIHLILEKIIEEGLYYPFKREIIFPIIEKSLSQSPLAGYEEIVYKKLKIVFQSPLKSAYDHFCLEQIPPNHMWGEVLFRYKLSSSSLEMNGFADLIIQYNDRFYIIDWKCNHLEDYTKEKIEEALTHHHYQKQASIYTKALQLFLESKNLSFEDHMGGAFYIFIRGEKNGIYYFSPKAMEDEEVLCLI